MRYPPIFGVLGLVLLASLSVPRTTGVSQASSVATPQAETCDVAPRSVAGLIALLGPAQGDDGQVLEPRPLPEGVPADAATTEAIAAVVRKLEACLNSGDQLRLYSLFSDDQFRQMPRIDDVVAELRALENVTPTPVPEGRRQVLVGPWHVEILEDGRVFAAVLFRFEDEADYPSSTKALLFVQQEGQWLIQEMTDLIWVEGASGPVAVADIVGPPPGA